MSRLFCFKEVIMDNLQESAIAYEKLLNKEYLLTIGKSGSTTTIKIVFEEEEFKHLTGIQHLDDTRKSPETDYAS